jgi:hypothetical protein
LRVLRRVRVKFMGMEAGCTSIHRDLVIKRVYRLAPLATSLNALSIMVE